MSDYIFPPAGTASLAIAGESHRFPLRRVFCIGRNYGWTSGGAGGAGAAQSLDAPPRDPPVFFMKPADAVVPAVGNIPYPPLTHDFCHEIELVVAIGKDGARIAPEDALAHVWGYAAGLDLTRRDLQAEAKQRGQPWEGAKAFDASAPCSALVPVATTGHPQTGAVWLNVNGQARQRADLSDLIWPVKDLISFLSHSVALKAGDLIFTGTPSGVAALVPGDVVTGGVDGVSQFSVTVAGLN